MRAGFTTRSFSLLRRSLRSRSALSKQYGPSAAQRRARGPVPRSQALEEALADGVPDLLHAFPHLSADDRRVLHAATGITHAADGSFVRRSTGHTPAWSLFFQVDGDRAGGALAGTMTSQYVVNLLSRAPGGDPLGVYLDRALDFLADRESRRPGASTSVDLRA